MKAESAKKRTFETYGTLTLERIKRHYPDLPQNLQNVFDLTESSGAIKLDVALRCLSFLMDYHSSLDATQAEGVDASIVSGFALLLRRFADEFRRVTPIEDQLKPVGKEEIEAANKHAEEQES